MKQEENKRLRVQLANGKVIIAKKEAQNRRNLKRLVNQRSVVKRKVRYISKTTTDHLQLVQQKLAAEQVKGKQLSEDLHQMDEEYCELEEKYTETQAQVHDFLEGTK